MRLVAENGDEIVADYGDDYIFDDGELVVHAQHHTE
jgi:hypothetical protein